MAEEDWQSMETAPKDGTEIYIEVGGKCRAYWDDELRTWVLSRPVHVESVHHPRRWLPVPRVQRTITAFGYRE